MNLDLPAHEEERLKALRRERFSNVEGEKRYKQLVEERAKRRQQLEAQGLMHKPGMQLEANKLVGTCTLMCPEFEREERQLKNSLAPQEMYPSTRQADPERTVKTFHRSAAGNEEPLPEDLRTPETLQRTMDYLVNVVIAGDQELKSCHGFVRDRTRSIRQDFTIQNIRDQTTVAVCERIARFHIVSLHILCGNKDFAEHQDMEQLRNTLKTLIELYDDHRKAQIACTNEAEFYAYYIVSHLRDPDAKRVAERLPKHIFVAPVVQQALKLHMLSEANVVTTRRDPGTQWAAQNLAVQFFRAVAAPDTPPLLACLAEYYFPSIRRAALKAMCDAFPYQEGKEYPVEEFAEMLAFDSVDQVREFCALFNVSVNQNGVKVGERVGGRIVFQEPDQKPRRTSPNLRVVGSKMHMTPMRVIDSNLEQRFLGSTDKLGILKHSRPSVTNGSAIKPAASRPLTKKPSFVSPPKEPAVKPATTSAGSASAFAKDHGGVFSSKSSVAATAAPLFPKDLAKPTPSTQPQQQQQQQLHFQFANMFAQQNAASISKPKQPELSQDKPNQIQPASASAPPASMQPLTFTPPAVLPAAQPAVAEPPQVVWNRPRHRINWTSLTNALYHDLIDALTKQVAAPVASHAKERAQVADRLSMDITQSIIDYTSAFVAYEESYRTLLLAQADAFRRKSMLRSVLDLWSMEAAARLQDYALQQRHLDEIEDIIDSEYRSQPQMAIDDVFSMAPAPQPAARPVHVTAPKGFWDSLHMGAECFSAIEGAMKRFGDLPLQALIEVSGTHGAAVLPSWLWWQIDPSSIEHCSPGSRLATYGNQAQQLKFIELAAHDSPIDGGIGITAQVVVLAAEPIGAADIRARSASDVSARIVSGVDQALERARAWRARGNPQLHPILFVFWSSGDTKAVRRLVERTANASGVPNFVATNVCALNIESSKQQLSTGLKWIFRHLLQARKATLVRVSKAYVPVVNALLQALQRMNSCVCELLDGDLNEEARITVFNLAVDTANMFLAVLNEQLLPKVQGAKIEPYPQATMESGISRNYFGSCQQDGAHMPYHLTSAVAAMLDDILSTDMSLNSQPSLGSCLRALEFVIKHQLDELQPLVPRTIYVDRQQITQATHDAVQGAERHVRRAAQLCQTTAMDWSPFVTPKNKRTMSLAFSASPPSLDLSRDSAAMSVSSVSTNSKRHRLSSSAQRLSRLQDAMARASKHLN
ncbi:actin cytoskeleton and mitosis protein [Coemansia sp. RSA 989]|nr:actin cytoskeleton and mitosis protein [Coemansia sp. RSA 989]